MKDKGIRFFKTMDFQKIPLESGAIETKIKTKIYTTPNL